MTHRTFLRLSLLLATVGPLAGCSAYGIFSTLSGLSPSGQTVSDVAADRIFQVQGQVRLPQSLTSARPLAEMPALTTVAPLFAVAPLAGVHVYGAAAVNFQAQTTSFGSGTVRETLIQFVDPETGEISATASTDVDGRYNARLVFKGTDHPFIAQTVLRNQFNQVVGFLAAPMGVDVSKPSGKHGQVDLSPGTTMIAFSSVLLSETYPTFDLRTGFVGVKSKRLAAMVGEVAPNRMQSAAALLDQSRTLSEAGGFDSLLSNTATASAVLTFQVKKLAMQALATDSITVEATGLNAAILGQLVERMALVTAPPAGSTQGFFEAIAQQVDLPSAKSQGEAIADTLPTLPPLPTPTPADGIGVTFE